MHRDWNVIVDASRYAWPHITGKHSQRSNNAQLECKVLMKWNVLVGDVDIWWVQSDTHTESIWLINSAELHSELQSQFLCVYYGMSNGNESEVERERRKKKQQQPATMATANICGVHAWMNEWTKQLERYSHLNTFHVIDHQRWKCRRTISIANSIHVSFSIRIQLHACCLPATLLPSSLQCLLWELLNCFVIFFLHT